MVEKGRSKLERQAEIVDGEIVAEFSDETLMKLPSVPDERSDIPLPRAQVGGQETEAGRRQFLTRLLVGGTAALALGGSTALLLSRRRREPTVVVLPNGVEISGVDAATDIGGLLERLATVEQDLANMTAERDRLVSSLSTATDELSQLRMQLDEMRTLNELWESLDAVGLDSQLQAAMVVIGSAIGAALNAADILREGLEKGQSALTNFIAALPGPQDGIRFLQTQISTLANNLDWLAQQVADVVDPVDPFASQIASFVLWVLDRLPFGAGDKAKAGMEAMQAVINSLPALVEGVSTKVLIPLAEWFGGNDQNNLSGILLTPISELVIVPARAMLDKFAKLETDYRTQLAEPVETILAKRRSIRDQIEQVQGA